MNNTNNPPQVDFFQVEILTLEKDIVNKVRNKKNRVDNSRNRVQNAIFTAIEILNIPNMELAMKSVSASSGWDFNMCKIALGKKRFYTFGLKRMQIFV